MLTLTHIKPIQLLTIVFGFAVIADIEFLWNTGEDRRPYGTWNCFAFVYHCETSPELIFHGLRSR